jgi:hypothetical protein
MDGPFKPFFKKTVARDLFYSSLFYGSLVWGPDFEAKKIPTLASNSRIFQEFRAVGYSDYCEIPL